MHIVLFPCPISFLYLATLAASPSMPAQPHLNAWRSGPPHILAPLPASIRAPATFCSPDRLACPSQQLFQGLQYSHRRDSGMAQTSLPLVIASQTSAECDVFLLNSSSQILPIQWQGHNYRMQRILSKQPWCTSGCRLTTLLQHR